MINLTSSRPSKVDSNDMNQPNSQRVQEIMNDTKKLILLAKSKNKIERRLFKSNAVFLRNEKNEGLNDSLRENYAQEMSLNILNKRFMQGTLI